MRVPELTAKIQLGCDPNDEVLMYRIAVKGRKGEALLTGGALRVPPDMALPCDCCEGTGVRMGLECPCCGGTGRG